MNDDLGTLREDAQVSIENLAKQLRVPVKRLRAWEAGTQSVPKRREQDIRWILAWEKLDRIVRDSGLPKCAWVESYQKEAMSFHTKKQIAQHEKRMADHLNTCSVCQDEAALLQKHSVRLPPAPKEAWWSRVGFSLLGPIVWMFETEIGRVVGILLMVAMVFGIGLLPHWGGYLFLIIPLGLTLGVIIGVGAYQWMRRTLPENEITCWLARCVGGLSFAWIFLSAPMVSGYNIFKLSEPPDWGVTLAIGSIMALFYATALTLVDDG